MDAQVMMMESLATPGTPINLQMLDLTVQAMQKTDSIGAKAREIISRFSSRLDSWTVSNDVLNSQQCSDDTKFIILTVLKNTIKTSWSQFDQTTKDSIIQFILPQSIQLANLNTNQKCVNMADGVIVEILKYEWPNNYPNFINDLLQSMKMSKYAFKNGMIILQELAKDIADYNNCGITSERSIEMTDAFEQQFTQIFDVVSSVFLNQDENVLSDSDVVHSTLKAMKSFISVVDIRFFIATPLFPILCNNYMSSPEYAFDVVDIFGEIANAIEMPPEFRELIPTVFKSVIQGLSPIITNENNEVKTIIASLDPNMVQVLASSLTSFLLRFSNIVLFIDDGMWARTAIEWLIQVTEVAKGDAFHTCLDFWMKVTRTCHNEFLKQQQQQEANNSSTSINQLPFYGSFFSPLEQILIAKFVEPFEVDQREDEDGIQWEEVIETTSPLYVPMKASLVFLTNMNSTEVFSLLMNLSNEASSNLEMLNRFAWNAACLTSSICDNFTAKAFEIVASSSAAIGNSFLWFVSQHPRFLAGHPGILQGVIQKILESLINDELRIFAVFALKSLFASAELKDAFVSNGFREPFINGLSSCNMLTNDFVIESASSVISYEIGKGHENNTPMSEEEKERLVNLLLSPNDDKWSVLSSNLDPSNIIPVILAMRVYGKAGYVLGPLFISHVTKILPSFVAAHEYYSNIQISTNEQAILIRRVKTSITSAIESFSRKLTLYPSNIVEFVISQCLQIASNFSNSPKETRDPAILHLFGLLCEKHGQILLPNMNMLFSLLFMPTVNIIANNEQLQSSFQSNGNFDAFDEDVINMHRSALLSFIDGAVKGCISFIALFNEASLNSFVSTILYLTSFLTKQEICSKSIKILSNFIESIRINASPEFISSFTANYGIKLVVDYFRIVTDPCYNFAFNEICSLFLQLLNLPMIKMNIQALVSTLQQNLFPQLNEEVLLQFVTSLVHSIEEKLIFRQYMRDFLINIKKVRRNDVNFMKDELELENNQLRLDLQNEMQMNVS